MEEGNEIRRVSNSEAGNIWAGWIVAQLAEAWPMRVDFDWMSIIQKTGVSIKSASDEQDAISFLFQWLETEGFIRSQSEQISEYFLAIEITNHTKSLLNAEVPSLASKNFKDAFSDAAKDVAQDAAKQAAGQGLGQLFEVFGQFVGGVFKNGPF